MWRLFVVIFITSVVLLTAGIVFTIWVPAYGTQIGYTCLVLTLIAVVSGVTALYSWDGDDW